MKWHQFAASSCIVTSALILISCAGQTTSSNVVQTPTTYEPRDKLDVRPATFIVGSGTAVAETTTPLADDPGARAADLHLDDGQGVVMASASTEEKAPPLEAAPTGDEPAASASADQASTAEQLDAGPPPASDDGGDKTGTDPRGFTSKFMPYYRYTELDNDLEVSEAVLFGMIALDDTGRWAMTYEMPIAKRIDYGDVDDFQELGLESGLGSGLFSSGGVAANGLEADGDTVGIGDLGLRIFYRPESLEWKSEGGANHTIMPALETTFPVASEDVLGSQTLIVSPAVVYVQDVKLLSPGFIAAMNFLDIDAWRDESVEGTFRYRGRWFLMQPLSRPGPKLTDGFYLLPELQPVWDINEKEFSVWVAPELGKILAPGRIAYLKPGVGIDPEPNERDYTMEIGFRWFF